VGHLLDLFLYFTYKTGLLSFIFDAPGVMHDWWISEISQLNRLICDRNSASDPSSLQGLDLVHDSGEAFKMKANSRFFRLCLLRS